MSLIYNDYQKIKQDNADAIAKISARNTGTVMKMFRYISAFNVSLFELEVIKKDIIGIVLEADAEKMKIEDKLGVSEKEFCDSLLQDGMKHNSWEKWMLRVKNFFLLLFGFQSFGLLASGFSNDWGITILDILLAFSCTITGEAVEQFAIRKGSYRGGKKENKLRSMGVLLITMIYYVFLFMLPLELMVFDGYGRLAWFGLMIISLTICTLDSAYWNRCSKQYDWK